MTEMLSLCIWLALILMKLCLLPNLGYSTLLFLMADYYNDLIELLLLPPSMLLSSSLD
jgi:hypothetical protein